MLPINKEDLGNKIFRISPSVFENAKNNVTTIGMYYEVLLNFILNYSWIKNREKPNASTRLEEDLYIYGDDAEKFLCEYSDRFSVDISNFNFSRYFTKRSLFLFYIQMS